VESRYRREIIYLSILLHILFLLVWSFAVKMDLVEGEPVIEVQPEQSPIVFDLQQPQKPREVIETPDDAKTVDEQKRANFLSDKNALARNPESPPELQEGAAFARGDLNTHELPRNQAPPGQKVPPMVRPDADQPQDSDKEGKQEKEPEIVSEDMSVENVVKLYEPGKRQAQPSQPVPPGQKERMLTVAHDNPNSRALETGGLSFNTYDWDFAPYMLMLKRRIGNNIFPPMAFTHLGLIDGRTLLRFRIYPDGRMTSLNVLRYQGHKTLMETSYNAVDISAPFPPLPEDFPEPYLEVTGTFIYFVRREN
jgi:outer membrane biosynthesis protein TonB